MWKRFEILGIVSLLALAALVPLIGGLPVADAAVPGASSGSLAASAAPKPNPYTDAWLAANHGRFDNTWTADYESRLQRAAKAGLSSVFHALAPAYGPDVRMSNGSVLGSNQNEFQIDINPLDNLNAIGSSNDSGSAGVGVFRTTTGGATWTSADASAYGIPAGSCCDPGVAYGPNGHVYLIDLNTSTGTYIIRSSDGGATWQGPSNVATPDRPNIATDPSNANIVYLTYSDLPATNRIKGYKSTDGGVTWGPSFFVGDVAPPAGYEQASQPRVASNGWLYVGYQQYTNSSAGCAAGVQNVLARSTDGGVTFTYTVVPIVQGGACTSAQAGRGIFCVNSGGSSFRSRSQFVVGVKPTDPMHVYVIYSGGDLETAYTCSGSTGFHSDILFRSSTDGGATFSAASKINTDAPGKDQYFPWMGVTASGQIWVGWNDRREDPNDFLSRWYQSYSNDEGATWLTVAGVPGNDPVADVQSLPSTFIGDYHGLAASTGVVLPMWWDSRISSAGDAYTDPQVPPLQGTATPTATGTPPTATRTRTATITPTATSTPSVTPTVNPCLVQNYVIATATGSSIITGTVDTGNHCDDCATSITLPFAYTLYGLSYTTAMETSNGQLDFGTADTAFTNACLPDLTTQAAIFPHWDDLRTDTGTGCTSYASGCGIFSSVTGTAPNRVYHLEWRAAYFDGAGQANFEVRLYEGQNRFDVVYGTLAESGSSATVGVQNTTGSLFTQFECNTGGLSSGLQLIFTLPTCGTATVTPTGGVGSTPTGTATVGSGTATATVVAATNTVVPPTNTVVAATNTVVAATNTVVVPTSTRPAATNTVIAGTATSIAATASRTTAPTATSTPCTISFTDVHPSDYFYVPVLYLACHGVISGYNDGTFRPYNNTTRSQMVKIVVLGFNKPIQTPAGGAFTFTDVPPTFPFFGYIETAAALNIVSGYTCGQAPAGPCDAQHRPWFLPYANVTRGQLSKIDVVAAGWAVLNPVNRTFQDVLPNTAFYEFVETAACHGVISGYTCGGPGEPCGTPPRPYFRQYNNAIRGQIAKIVYLSVTGAPGACAPTPTN